MTRYKITAYIIDFVGVLLLTFYGVGYSIKESHAYQIATGTKPKISVEEGSFWLTTNTEPFLYPGIALVIIGMAMILHDIKKSMNAQANQQAEDKS